MSERGCGDGGVDMNAVTLGFALTRRVSEITFVSSRYLAIAYNSTPRPRSGSRGISNSSTFGPPSSQDLKSGFPAVSAR
jgi:hypothetical protein